MSTTNVTPYICTLPCNANTPSRVAQDVELAGLVALAGAAPCWVNVQYPNGAMPYNPACPNFRGLPWNTNISVALNQQSTQSNMLGLLFLLVILWAIFKKGNALP